ncbi:MAG: YihY/virulence factor BrkB family protein [Actinomycetota bacterium]|nr:YihY/virulence factor BrkB family protein [Actinomycetota bacterium]
MSPVHRLLERADRTQQRYAPLAFFWAVNKKYGDDNGGSLATLLTYNAFLALFPLLLVLVTVLGMVAGSSSRLTHEVVGSALRQFPVIGTRLGANIHALHRDSAIGLLVGVLGLLWGSLGAAQAGQYAMAEVWNIPKTQRPGYLPRLVRSVAVLGGLGLFLVLSTGLSTVATDTATHGLILRIVVGTGSLIVNVVMMGMAFRALTPQRVGTGQLLPGVVVAGVGWSVLQGAGAYLVAHDLRDDTAIYGFFAVVLGALAWLYLTMRLVLYAAEVNVVWHRHLWPRSLHPPLTTVDRLLLATYIEQEERRPEVGAAAFVRPAAGSDAPDGHPPQAPTPASGPHSSVDPGSGLGPIRQAGDRTQSTQDPQRTESFFTGSPGELGTVQRRPEGTAAERTLHQATTAWQPRRQR